MSDARPDTKHRQGDGISSSKHSAEAIDFDDYSGAYETLLGESVGKFADSVEYFAWYKAAFIRRFYAGSVGRILEYGCGTGRNIPFLKAAFENAEVVGTDISRASLAIAGENNPGIRFETEAPDLDLGLFDLVFVANVFHHIPPSQRPMVMKSLADRLAPEAKICIFEHNPFNPVTRRIVSTCPFDADAILLKPAELRRLFDDSGIELVDLSYCLFVPPRLSSLLALERYLTWLPLGGQYAVVGTPRPAPENLSRPPRSA